ncbi:MAG: GNAT family N-acetyltransferase [Pseudomonadales bacterium]|jgi:ribosomal protein S18 acetylase RimI-like enzyme
MKDFVRVRAATRTDLDVLVDFNLAMARESEDRALDRELLRAGVSGLLARSEDGFYLVAEQAGYVAGSLMVTYEWSDWRNGRFWWIQSVYVRPERRRQGVYTAMHAAVRERAEASGDACGIRLYVERENTGAMATYRSLGMQETEYRLYEEEFARGKAR